MALVSLRAYARHRGVALSAVQKAIETGRITLTDTVKKKIDPEVADIQWAKNTRPDQQERGSLKDFERTQADLAALSAAPADAVPASAPSAPPSGLSVEKAETEAVKRELLQLQLEQKRGELVRKDDFKRAWANKLKSASAHLDSVADRLSPKLAAETDVGKVDEMLRSELRRAMGMIALPESGES